MSIFNHQSEKFSPPNGSHPRPLVIITGYYGFDNLGDEAILEELLAELKSIWPQQNTIVLSNNPHQTASSYEVKSVNRWDWFLFIKLLRQSKWLISGGGGLFQDRTGIGSVIFYATQIFLARLCGAQVFIYAQGLGPLRGFLSNQLTRIAFQQAKVITLRDSHSLAMINAWGLEGDLTADSVWSLSASPLSSPIKTLLNEIKKGMPGKPMAIGLSLRDDPQLKDFHLELLASNIATIFPPATAILLLPAQKDRDYPLLEQINKYLQRLGLSTHLLDPTLLIKPSQWLALMDNLDLVIGMRLHVLLMALSAGKPVIGIAYDAKVTILLNDYEQPLLPLNIEDNESCKTIWLETMVRAANKYEELSNSVKRKLVSTRQLASRNAAQLANILSNGHHK